MQMPNPDPFTQQMSFAACVGAAFVFGWFARIPERFIRFWILKPPYKPRTVLIFRILFIAWSGSGAYGAINGLVRMDRTARDWSALLKYSIVWIVVWWLMVKFVELINQRRHRDVRSAPPPPPSDSVA